MGRFQRKTKSEVLSKHENQCIVLKSQQIPQNNDDIIICEKNQVKPGCNSDRQN